MSMRMTHFFGITTPIGMYDSFDKALKEAEALKIKLDRICKNKGYSCLAYIGVSQNDKHNGTVKIGYRGKREFMPYDEQEIIYKEPHIHIIIFANPAETLRRCICEYFNKRHKGTVCWATCCDNYFENDLTYIMKQSLYYRAVACNVEMLSIDDLNAFCNCAEDVNRSMNGVAPVFKGVSDSFFYNTASVDENNNNDLFTVSSTDEEEKVIDSANTLIAESILNKLQCNNKYNNINIYNKLNILNILNRLIKLSLYNKNSKINCINICKCFTDSNTDISNTS